MYVWHSLTLADSHHFSRECRGEAAIDKSFPTTVVESVSDKQLTAIIH